MTSICSGEKVSDGVKKRKGLHCGGTRGEGETYSGGHWSAGEIES